MRTKPVEAEPNRQAGPEGAIIVARAVTKRFGETVALDSVDVSVRPGEVYGILGPNGAGKTTLLRIILALVRPDAGSVSVFGERPGAGAALRRIGSMIETPAFIPGFSGRTNLRVLARACGLSDDHVTNALARVGLADAADRSVKGYSLGMRQRLGVAAALLAKPDVLLLDEPTNGLDPAGVVAMRDLIAGIASEGATVVVSSHVLSEIEHICTRVIVLDAGSVIADADLTDITHGHRNLEEAFFALTTPAADASWTE